MHTRRLRNLVPKRQEEVDQDIEDEEDARQIANRRAQIRKRNKAKKKKVSRYQTSMNDQVINHQIISLGDISVILLFIVVGYVHRDQESAPSVVKQFFKAKLLWLSFNSNKRKENAG
jgi:hypothetical protein